MEKITLSEHYAHVIVHRVEKVSEHPGDWYLRKVLVEDPEAYD